MSHLVSFLYTKNCVCGHNSTAQQQHLIARADGFDLALFLHIFSGDEWRTQTGNCYAGFSIHFLWFCIRLLTLPHRLTYPFSISATVVISLTEKATALYEWVKISHVNKNGEKRAFHSFIRVEI